MNSDELNKVWHLSWQEAVYHRLRMTVRQLSQPALSALFILYKKQDYVGELSIPEARRNFAWYVTYVKNGDNTTPEYFHTSDVS